MKRKKRLFQVDLLNRVCTLRVQSKNRGQNSPTIHVSQMGLEYKLLAKWIHVKYSEIEASWARCKK